MSPGLIITGALAIYFGNKIWSLKDSAEKLIVGFGGARFKGGKLSTGFSGGSLNLELLFNIANPGKTTIKIDFLMLDAILNIDGGQQVTVGQVRIDQLEEKRKSDPSLFTFPAQQSTVLVIPVSIALLSLSNAQILFSVVQGKKILSISAKGYVMANGIRIEINETKEFGKNTKEDDKTVKGLKGLGELDNKVEKGFHKVHKQGVTYLTVGPTLSTIIGDRIFETYFAQLTAKIVTRSCKFSYDEDGDLDKDLKTQSFIYTSDVTEKLNAANLETKITKQHFNVIKDLNN